MVNPALIGHSDGRADVPNELLKTREETLEDLAVDRRKQPPVYAQQQTAGKDVSTTMETTTPNETSTRLSQGATITKVRLQRVCLPTLLWKKLTHKSFLTQSQRPIASLTIAMKTSAEQRQDQANINHASDSGAVVYDPKVYRRLDPMLDIKAAPYIWKLQTLKLERLLSSPCKIMSLSCTKWNLVAISRYRPKPNGSLGPSNLPRTLLEPTP